MTFYKHVLVLLVNRTKAQLPHGDGDEVKPGQPNRQDRQIQIMPGLNARVHKVGHKDWPQYFEQKLVSAIELDLNVRLIHPRIQPGPAARPDRPAESNNKMRSHFAV